MFDQRQIAEFKEAFSMIDHDSDGFIDREDLKDMLASLGTRCTVHLVDTTISFLFKKVKIQRMIMSMP